MSSVTATVSREPRRWSRAARIGLVVLAAVVLAASAVAGYRATHPVTPSQPSPYDTEPD